MQGMFKGHARAGVDKTKMKAKFTLCDQVKFNEPVLKPETSGWQHFSFVDSYSPYRDPRILHGHNLWQKPMCLVGTVLK